MNVKNMTSFFSKDKLNWAETGQQTHTNQPASQTNSDHFHMWHMCVWVCVFQITTKNLHKLHTMKNYPLKNNRKILSCTIIIHSVQFCNFVFWVVWFNINYDDDLTHFEFVIFIFNFLTHSNLYVWFRHGKKSEWKKNLTLFGQSFQCIC